MVKVVNVPDIVLEAVNNVMLEAVHKVALKAVYDVVIKAVYDIVVEAMHDGVLNFCKVPPPQDVCLLKYPFMNMGAKQRV